MRCSPIVSVPCLFLLLAVTACANPADGKPEAVVRDATPPAAATSGDDVFAFGPEDSSVEFVGSKVTGQHEGGFEAFGGQIRLVGGKPELSSVEVEIDTTSLWSDNDRLTGHLKSPDFFDVEAFPKASFRSTEVKPNEDGGYTVTGNLDLHGVTKNVSFPATIVVEDGRVKAQAEFFVKRFDFGIEYKGKADDLIRDEVVIRLDLDAAPNGDA